MSPVVKQYIATLIVLAHLAALGTIAWELDKIREHADDIDRQTWKLYTYACDDRTPGKLGCY